MAERSNRIFLSVPFQEKEKAKELGARWDLQEKHWWIRSDVDTTPFARWLKAVSSPAPIYSDLAAIDLSELDELNSNWTIEVFFVPWTCWKCKQSTLAFHGVVNRSICVTPLFYQATVLDELDKLRKEVKQERFGCVKPRFSRTLNAQYVSQGCRHCDALIGEFPLWEEFNEFLTTTNISTYPLRKTLNWSLLGKR